MNWKPISETNGEYLVSDTGLVFSAKSGKLLKQTLSSAGYYRVQLWINGQGKHCAVHRLVADAFVPNPNKYPVINHKDENKLNNRATNLEWCTYQYNVNYGSCIEKRISNRRYETGKDHVRSKAVYQFSLDGQFIAEYESCHLAGIETGLNYKSIQKARSGQLKTFAGYVWLPTKEFSSPSERPSFRKAGAVFQYTVFGEFVRKYENPNETKSFGFDPNAVRDVCRGKMKTHKGYVFTYKEKLCK